MEIIYKNIKNFRAQELKDLFLSVGWSSGQYPDKLRIAMKNSDRVISAWDNNTLVGLINALSDGIMTVYFHYLLVNPKYHGQGIGKRLLTTMLDHYKDYARKAVIAYNKEIDFYKKLGFSTAEDASPMFITFLTT